MELASICSFDNAGTLNPNLTCDDNGSYTVILTVDDGVNPAVSSDATVTVNNMAPTAIFANTSGDLLQGESATLTFSNPSDPSAADTAAGFLYSYDCTDDSVFELSDTAQVSHDCVYPQSGIFTARGFIEDKDGDSSPYTVEVTVLAPVGAIVDLIDIVQDLNLQQGVENSLDKKLENAQDALDDMNSNNDGAAINKLQAFINEVEAQRGTKITDEQADSLIGWAQRIIASLS